MWLAVIIFVSLSVEVLSYLTGEKSAQDNSGEQKERKISPEAA